MFMSCAALRQLTGAAGTLVLLCAPNAQGQSPVSIADVARRRAAALVAAQDRAVIVPAQPAFKGDQDVGFRETSDFFYLTGIDHVVGGVLVLDGAARSSVLFLPHPSALVKRPDPRTDHESATRLGLTAVFPVDSLEPWLRSRFGSWRAVSVAPTDARGAVAAPPPMANSVVRWTDYLTKLGFSRPVESAVALLRPQREIKDPGEIGVLERVARSSGIAMLAGIRGLRPGRQQRDVEIEIVSACVASGARSHSFWPWAMSGPHAVFSDLFDSFVDYDGHNRAMRAGELVRVDVGCEIAHYMGDVGRTAPVSGHFDAGQREAWDLFIAGYRAGLSEIRDGARTTDVYRAALARVRELAPSLRTSLGRETAEILLGPRGTDAWEIHGVGLDDAEGLPDALKSGMTVAYELMFEAGGQGFYLEDMILVQPAGPRMLTAGLPYTAAEIEAAMRKR